MSRKEYKLPNGKKAVFEYDVCGIGKITLECMDELMGMIADRPQGEWNFVTCGECKKRKKNDFCLEHMRYEKNDEGYCSYGEREGE